MVTTTRAIRLSKALMDISQRLRGTALDVLPGADNIHRYNATDVDFDNLLLLPVSRERYTALCTLNTLLCCAVLCCNCCTFRKYRRLMIVLSMFEDVSKRGDMMDAAELKQYLLGERNSLVHALTLIRADVMALPSVSANFVPGLSDPFSLTRSVMCCHLLASSDKLNQLFSRYDTHGKSMSCYTRTVNDDI